MKLGGITLEIPFVQAPLSGITDAPFRAMARKFHRSLVYTEMISAEALCRGGRRTMQIACIRETDHPCALQLVGNNPSRMAEAARIAERLGADVVDINAACPEEKVIRTGAGGALLRKPALLAECVRRVAGAVTVPVSVKMRLGWSGDDSVSLVRLTEESGAAFVTLHGRTVRQKFSGRSDWAAIRRAVSSVSIPLLANGDALDERRAVELLAYTHAPGVMLARGTRGRPDLPATAASLLADGEFKRMERADVFGAIREHARLACDYFGEGAAMRRIRKHILWYFKTARVACQPASVNALSTLAEMDGLLDGLEIDFA